MKNRSIFIFTSALCVLPIILSLVLYRQLPDNIAIHWNNSGEVNRYMPKALAAFGMPLFFLAINLSSKLRLFNDPKQDGHSKALRLISIWAIPIASLIFIPAVLFIALDLSIPIVTITTLAVGLLFIALDLSIPIVTITTLAVGLLLTIIGNYLPKNRQNYVMGIKLPWTLDSEENWNKTNKVAGYVLVSGFISAVNPVFCISFTLIVAILATVVPFIYSYVLYGKTSKGKSE